MGFWRLGIRLLKSLRMIQDDAAGMDRRLGVPQYLIKIYQCNSVWHSAVIHLPSPMLCRHSQEKSRMEITEFKLRGEHIALCDLLKLTGVADSGGQGKLLVASGEVTVDGQPEFRKTAKIRVTQTVRCLGQSIVVVAA